MSLLTPNYSLFLPPKGNNAGDLGKPLNENFMALDEILWQIRTNYANVSNPSVPIGALLFDSVSEKLYVKVSTGLKEVGSGVGGGGGGTYTTEDLLFLLRGSITTDQLTFDLSTRIGQIDANLQESIQAKDDAIQAASDAIIARGDAIQAANDAAGFRTNAYDWSEDARTQASLASGYATTSSEKAEEASSSAGAAGRSASLSEGYKIEAQTAAEDASGAQTAAASARDEAFGWKTAAEAAAGAVHEDAVRAALSAEAASGYADAAFEHKNSALSYSDQAQTYAIAAEAATGIATNAAGQAEVFYLKVAEASGDIQNAMDTTSLNAENASGYAESSRLYSVSASGYAQSAREDAELVASYLGAAEVSGYIGVEAEARASEDAALALRIDTLSTTVGENTTTIQTHQESIDGIKGTYAIKIDNNGSVAGFGLMSEMVSGGVSSEFAVLADKFKISSPGQAPGEATQIFTVNGDTGTIGINADVIIGTDSNGDGGIRSDELATYKVEIVSSNGIYLRKTTSPTEVLSVLSAIVHKGSVDVTNILPADRFKWTRQSYPPNNQSDINWNNAHFGGTKTVNLTSEDVHSRATFTCEILEN